MRTERVVGRLAGKTECRRSDLIGEYEQRCPETHARKQSSAHVGEFRDRSVQGTLRGAKSIVHKGAELLALLVRERMPHRFAQLARNFHRRIFALLSARLLRCLVLLMVGFQRLRGFAPAILKRGHHDSADQSANESRDCTLFHVADVLIRTDIPVVGDERWRGGIILFCVTQCGRFHGENLSFSIELRVAPRPATQNWIVVHAARLAKNSCRVNLPSRPRTCANVHCRGSLSGRQRRNFVPWRKRPPEKWS